MKVPAENNNANPILLSVAKEVSFSIKKVRIDTIGEDIANNNRYILDRESLIPTCLKNEDNPKAVGPLWSIIAINTIKPISVLVETEAPTASPSTAP